MRVRVHVRVRVRVRVHVRHVCTDVKLHLGSQGGSESHSIHAQRRRRSEIVISGTDHPDVPANHSTGQAKNRN